jgi:hypothetical protein
MRQSRRFSVNWPCATLLPPASFFSTTGMMTSRVVPLIESRPAISKRSPPRSFTALDANRATGNFAVSNQSVLRTSASVSSLARSMLPSSISNSARDFAGSFGRKSTLAFHLRNLPSTAAPICLD